MRALEKMKNDILDSNENAVLIKSLSLEELESILN